MDLQEGDKVSLVIETETALGYTVLINEEFDGLLFRSEVFQDLEENNPHHHQLTYLQDFCQSFAIHFQIVHL